MDTKKKENRLKTVDPIRYPTRRALLTRGSLVVGVAGLLTNPRLLAAGGQKLVLDVAIKGDTYRINPPRSAMEGNPPRAGDTIFAEGNIYPGGRIPPGPGFVITEEDKIGRFLYRGMFIVDFGEAPPPNAISTFLFFVDEVGTLVDEGYIGGPPEVIRVVTGGSGKFKGAHGQDLLTVIGTNTTIVPWFGGAGSNLRFSFDLTK